MAQVTRRQFLKSAAMAAGLAASVPVLEACAQVAATPVVIKEKVAETVIVEKVVTTEKEVTKVVEKPVTQVVEKQVTKLVEVTPTTEPTPTPFWVAEPTKAPLASPQEIEVQVLYANAGKPLNVFVKSMVALFQKTYPGVTVKVHQYGDTAVNAAITTREQEGNPIGVYWSFNPIWGAFFLKVIEEGLYYDLTSAMDEPAWGQPNKKWRETFKPQILENLMTWEGRIYNVPVDCNFFPLVYYNETLFKKLDIPEPETWKDFLAACEKLKAKDIWPIGSHKWGYGWATFMEMLLWRVLGRQGLRELFAYQGRTWLDPEPKQVFTMAKELMDKKYVVPGWQGMDGTEVLMLVTQEKAGMHVDMAVAIGPDANWWGSRGYAISVFPVPMVEGGKGNRMDLAAYVNAYAVRAKAKNPELCAEWLRMVSAVEIQKEFLELRGNVSPVLNVPLPSYPGARKMNQLREAATDIQPNIGGDRALAIPPLKVPPAIDTPWREAVMKFWVEELGVDDALKTLHEGFSKMWEEALKKAG